MTTIKLNITLDDSCNLTVADTTNFYDSVTNITGFLPESNADSLSLNKYKLSHGYFLNVILYNAYASTPTIVNTSESFYKVTNVNTTYASNFVPSVYNLVSDGSYTLTRYFIPSDTFYGANHTNSIYNGKTMYYTDGTTIFKVISGVATPVSVLTFIGDDLTFSNTLSTSSQFISTCRTNICYFNILSTLLDINIGVCQQTSHMASLIESRDLLYMTLEVVKYLKDANNISQIQKVLETINLNGGICASTLGLNSVNCGCNG